MPSTQKPAPTQPSHTQHIALAECGPNPIRTPASSAATALRATPDALALS
jgi:hypothetical protein